jgi:hypothetical protein
MLCKPGSTLANQKHIFYKPEGQGFSPANNRRAEGATALPKASLSSFAFAFAVAFALALAVAVAVALTEVVKPTKLLKTPQPTHNKPDVLLSNLAY